MMAENGPIVLLLFLALIIICLKDVRPFFKVTKQKSKTLLQTQHKQGIRKQNTDLEPIRADTQSKTIAIAIIVILLGWLMYIFFGNQAYSVWTYFYLGMAAATKNLIYKYNTDDQVKKSD